MAGPNKIPNAVYRNLAIFFAPKFRDLMNEIVRTGKMPNHMLQGDVSQLYKKNDREDPRN